jgi:hypothetical protein
MILNLHAFFGTIMLVHTLPARRLFAKQQDISQMKAHLELIVWRGFWMLSLNLLLHSSLCTKKEY